MTLTFPPEEPFESYSQRFSDFFAMRREDGIIEVRMHTDGGPVLFGFELHRAFGQMFRAVGADRENEVMILTGTGDHWALPMKPPSAEVLARESAGRASAAKTAFDPAYGPYDRTYTDGIKLMEEMIWAVNIPVIAAVNGPGFHTETAFMADLTLCTPDARFVEPHFTLGIVPGDGNFLILQELIGIKRANKAMYLGQPISAQQALDWGLVNDIVPRDDLAAQSWAMARHLMARPREVRGLTAAVARQRWKTLLSRDLSMNLTHQISGSLIRPISIQSQDDIVSGESGYFEMK
ncbi:enoyl-CoA hydratase/isomerase family protein [Croceicoccus sediminis]|uniref:enoyl-CoA hydratase/isomerase family protein n=1 Tax=Croceicoccus sediminis TaxID=2571150 RepID=UPI001184091F|nr:enoyl-CoA hydratase/isomerase family protein [Croceicoccus sediminis]